MLLHRIVNLVWVYGRVIDLRMKMGCRSVGEAAVVRGFDFGGRSSEPAGTPAVRGFRRSRGNFGIWAERQRSRQGRPSQDLGETGGTGAALRRGANLAGTS